MVKTKPTNSSSWCKAMMKGCAKYCYWFPVMGMLFMGALLLFGYYLDAETVRYLWLIFAGIGVLMIVLGWIMMGAMMRGISRKGRSGFNCPCFRLGDTFVTSRNSSNEETNCCY